MKSVNLSEWAVKHGALVAFFMVLVSVAGGYAYFHLGRDEDPQFTVKTMVVRAYLPGATIEETTLQLTDRIEKKLQETPSLDYLKSYTLAGETTIFVHLLTSTDKKDVPDIWYQVRKKVGDIKAELPSGTIGPFFQRRVRGYLRHHLRLHLRWLHAPGAQRLRRISAGRAAPSARRGQGRQIGFQDEKVYIEFSSHQLANLGISRASIVAALQEQNILTPSGVVDTEKEQVVVEATGKFGSDESLRNVTVYAGSKKVRLVDIATITHAYSDPPQPGFRYNGIDAIGLAVHMRKGAISLRSKRT